MADSHIAPAQAYGDQTIFPEPAAFTLSPPSQCKGSNKNLLTNTYPIRSLRSHGPGQHLPSAKAGHITRRPAPARPDGTKPMAQRHPSFRKVHLDLRPRLALRPKNQPLSPEMHLPRQPDPNHRLWCGDLQFRSQEAGSAPDVGGRHEPVSPFRLPASRFAGRQPRSVRRPQPSTRTPAANRSAAQPIHPTTPSGKPPTCPGNPETP